MDMEQDELEKYIHFNPPKEMSTDRNSDVCQFFLQCSDCRTFFKTEADCDKHKLNSTCTTQSYPRPIFSCSKCKHTFHESKDCFQHMKSCSKQQITTDVPFYACQKCQKKFKSKYSCLRHIQRNKCCSNARNEWFFQCHKCLLKLASKYSLIKHFSQNVCQNPKNSKCFIEKCTVYLRKREHMIEHLKLAHKNVTTFEGSDMNWENMEVERLSFTSDTYFQQWMETISCEYNCNYFLSSNKMSKNSVNYKLFRCQYDKRLYPNKVGPLKRAVKPNLFCPSRVCSRTVNGKIHVTYYKTHNHQPLSSKRKKLSFPRSAQYYLETVEFSDDENDLLLSENDFYRSEDSERYEQDIHMTIHVEDPHGNNDCSIQSCEQSDSTDNGELFAAMISIEDSV